MHRQILICRRRRWRRRSIFCFAGILRTTKQLLRMRRRVLPRVVLPPDPAPLRPLPRPPEPAAGCAPESPDHAAFPARICRRPLLGAASRLDPAPRASPASSPPGSDAVCRLIADCGEGDGEEEEEAPELLLLRIGRALLLHCLLEVELHHGAQGLRRRLSRDHASDDRNRGCMAVKAHFIDQSWTLQSRLLRFLHVPWPRTAEVNGLYVRMK